MSSIALMDEMPAEAQGTSSLGFVSGAANTGESVWRRRICFALACGLTVGFFLLLKIYFVPAPGTPGVDENAYLVGGANIVDHLSTGFQPENPFSFVGPMWIRAASGWYYPKYPFGVPLLDAMTIKVFGHATAAFWVSPICATLAVLAMFLLTRLVLGSFAALLAAVILAGNSTMLQLAIVPSSHAPAICTLLWGFYFVFRWQRGESAWLGALGGFLLGYTVTIRYSEGLLVLSLAAICLMTIRWTNWRTYLRAAIPPLAWAVPVALLLAFNHAATGHWTGYDSTGESTGFTWAEFKVKWESTIQELDLSGLYFILAPGLLGMLLLFFRSWRLGTVMALWFVPELLLYMAYYWGGQGGPGGGGPGGGGVGYLRFFLTIYPPVILCAVFLIQAAAAGMSQRSEGVALARDRSLFPVRLPAPVGLPAAFASLIFVGGVVALCLCATMPELSRQRAANKQLAFSADAFTKAVAKSKLPSAKGRPVFFSDEQGGMASQLVMDLQFVAGGEWYTIDSFTTEGGMGGGGPMGGGRGPGGPGGFGGRGGGGAAGGPTAFDPQRQAYMRQVYAHLTDQDLIQRHTQIVEKALNESRPVYAILTVGSVSQFRRQLASEGFDCKMVATWREPVIPAGDNFGPGGPGGRGGRGGRGGPPGGPGGFGGPGGPGGFGGPGGGRGGFGGPGGESFPQTLQVLQITSKSAT